MAQISKRYVDRTLISRIEELLLDLLLNLADKKEVNNVLNELLTPTEKTMITKRVACFYLFIKNISIHEIEDTLKISTSTVAYFKHFLDRSEVIKKYLSNKLKNDKLKHLIEDIFVDLFYGTLKKGSNWSEDKRIFYQHQRKRQQPMNR